MCLCFELDQSSIGFITPGVIVNILIVAHFVAFKILYFGMANSQPVYDVKSIFTISECMCLNLGNQQK